MQQEPMTRCAMDRPVGISDEEAVKLRSVGQGLQEPAGNQPVPLYPL